MADSIGPGRPAAFAQRHWWINLVIGVGFLVLAARWAIDRDDGWPVFAALWAVLGVGQVVIGVINRREGRRRR